MQVKECEALLVSTGNAAKLLEISKRHFQALESTGKIGPLPVCALGRCKRYSVSELKKWIVAGCPTREKWASCTGGPLK